MTKLIRINRTAMENAAAYDRKYGGQTMPENAVPVWGPFKRKKKPVVRKRRPVMRNRTIVVRMSKLI